MPGQMSDRERALFEEPNFAHFGTLDEDGHPHVSVVWIDVEGDLLVVNSAEGRHKVDQARRDARVGLSVHQQSNPYNSVSVRGTVVEVTNEGADEHIDKMAKKYLGQDTYPFRAPGERRVIIRVRPDAVSGYFSD